MSDGSLPPLALERFGSFHVGGRVIHREGEPVKQVLFSPGKDHDPVAAFVYLYRQSLRIFILY